MKHIPIFLIRLYRKFLSPLLPPSCRFTPTCSAYAITAFQKRGFFVGLYLSVRRILRCNPFCRAGYDPVPEKRSKIQKPIPKYMAPVRRYGDGNRKNPEKEAKELPKGSTPSRK